MELDPIVLLAYVSVAINIVTVIAAGVAYLVFHLRRRRRRRPPQALAETAHPAGRDAAAPYEPVFLKPYRPPGAARAPDPTEPA